MLFAAFDPEQAFFRSLFILQLQIGNSGGSRGFQPPERERNDRAFTGCGKTHSGAQKASGHDFSRAVSVAESIQASAPAARFSGISVELGPFSAACLGPGPLSLFRHKPQVQLSHLAPDDHLFLPGCHLSNRIWGTGASQRGPVRWDPVHHSAPGRCASSSK